MNIRARAAGMVARAIGAGVLVRRPCEACGTVKAHAHHDDYLKPLEVRWLCPLHHVAWHKTNVAANRTTVVPARERRPVNPSWSLRPPPRMIDEMVAAQKPGQTRTAMVVMLLAEGLALRKARLGLP